MPRRTDDYESNRIFSHDPKIQAFYEKHGKSTFVGGYVLFEDGAALESDGQRYGRIIEPPEDEYERAQAIYKFWSIKCQQTENAFLRFKRMCTGEAMEICWPSHIRCDADKIEHLEKLQREARQARAKFRKAEAALEASEPDWLRIKREEQASELRQREKLKRRVSDIRI